jgi:peptidoglycan L-alanyl-D-glutamate endopeptidase CwlK
LERGTFKLSSESEKILSTVRPDLQRVIRHAASITTTPFAVVSGNRTQAQQDYLYAQGRTRPGLVVTWTRNSNHMGGGAIDFSAVDMRGKPTNHLKHTWNADYYKPIANTILEAGRQLGIPVEWPLWKKGDWGHIQLTKPYRPLTVAEARSGVYEKVPVLQSRGEGTGSRSASSLPDKQPKEIGIQSLDSPLLSGVQQTSIGSQVSNNEGPDGVPFAKTPSEGGSGAQASLPTAGNRPSGAARSLEDLSHPGPAIAFLEQYGWKRHQAVALVANGIWESGGKTYLKCMALGDGGTAHGAFQWRGDRYIGRNGLYSFVYKYYPGHSTAEPQVQLAYVDWELRNTERRAGNLLKEAETLEEAVKAAISYLRPVHFTWEEPEKGHGYARRLEIAKGLI